MRVLCWSLSGFLLGLLLISCDTKKVTDRRRIPVETFFRNPEESNFQLSPNGKKLLFLRRTDFRLNLFCRDLHTGLEYQLTYKKQNDIENFYWVNNKRIVYIDDIEGKQSCQLYTVKSDGTSRINLTPYADIRVYIIDGRVYNGNEMLVSFNQRGSNLFDVYRLNTETGQTQRVMENNGRITKWFADQKGIIRMALEVVEGKSRLLYRQSETDSFKTLLTPRLEDKFVPLTFKHNSNKLYALSNRNRDKMALVTIEPTAPDSETVVFENANTDISEFNFGSRTHRLIDVAYRSNRLETWPVDVFTKKTDRYFRNRFPDKSFRILSSDSIDRNFIVKVFSDKLPGQFYLFDTQKETLRQLSDINPDINPQQMAESRLIYIPASDGGVITAMLTMPQVLPNGPISFVVYVNQAATYNIGTFDPLSQFLSNRGYGVLQVYYRGINGFGKRYRATGFRGYAGRSLEDVIESSEWLIESGFATKGNIAVYGAFFGGFAAMNAAIRRPDLYACSVSYAGFYNLLSYVEGVPEYFKPYQMMLFEMMGNPREDSLNMRQNSPYFQTSKIQKPVFIYHGKYDPRVSYHETNRMVGSIRRNKIEVEYMLVSNEGRGMKKEENRLEFYRKLEEFLARHLH